MKLALIGGKAITPFRIVNNSVIVIEDGIISNLGREGDISFSDDTEVIDCSGLMITPGFVDLLCHGGAGHGFADGSVDSIETIADYFLSHGSTTLLASLFAKPKNELLSDLERVSKYIISHPESNIFGIHMEGPYLNKEL
jgi:N-acetylglucosamine-6-phosphate deacetylase